MRLPIHAATLGYCLTPLLITLPTEASAHAFFKPPNLPLPYWLYINGGISALVISFILIGFLLRPKPKSGIWRELAFGDACWLQQLRALHIRGILRLLSVLLLTLCIATGYFGANDPYRNFNMTFFWIVFGLGFFYFSALIGDFYPLLSPWRVLADWARKLSPTFGDGVVRYPEKWGYWPAILLYLGFIWIELLGNTRPRLLAEILLAYTLLNLFYVWLIGTRAWFQYGEFFGVLMRLVGRIAPICHDPEVQGAKRWRLRLPFAGLLDAPTPHFSLVLFVLFMLSSTAFDGLSETVLWFELFWRDSTGIIQPLIGEHPIKAYVWLRPWYFVYQTFWLMASPFLYLALFLLFLWLGRVAAGHAVPMKTLLAQNTLSLLPIAFVYHFTHYYTLLLSQGVKIRALISDPFTFGWDLFGTHSAMRDNLSPTIETVWYTQVFLIVVGHVISVFLAHREALRLYPTRGAALRSQVPMLVLMMLFTGAGLWILAQPMMGR